MQSPDFIIKYANIHPLRCAIEVYHCSFCKFNNDTRTAMENHYYYMHEKELEKIQGGHLSRKIDLLITNGDKSFVKALLY